MDSGIDRGVVEAALAELGAPRIWAAIRYGRIGGNDVDIFLVLTESHDFESITRSRFDITHFGRPEVGQAWHHFDPLVTEPLLTGHPLFGANLSRYAGALRQRPVGRSSVCYLLSKAQLLSDWTKAHLHQGDKDAAVETLAFSVSFRRFADHYSTNHHVTTFSSLVQRHSDSDLAHSHKLRKGSVVPADESIMQLLERNAVATQQLRRRLLCEQGV